MTQPGYSARVDVPLLRHLQALACLHLLEVLTTPAMQTVHVIVMHFYNQLRRATHSKEA